MIPDWLTPWWNWWARFTDLLAWDALGVVGVAIAGVWALLNWQAANRDRRRREGALLQRAANPIATVVKSLEPTLKKIRAGDDPQKGLQSWLKSEVIEHQLADLDAKRDLELPTILSVEIISAAYGQIAGLRNFALGVVTAEDEQVLRANMHGVNECQRYLAAYVWKLEQEAKRIAGKLERRSVNSVDDIYAEIIRTNNCRKKPLIVRLVMTICGRGS